MPHISYSELKDWKFCAHYHKLTRVDKIDGFTGNEYTAFGETTVAKIMVYVTFCEVMVAKHVYT